jgi:hypothetical protein
MLNIEQACQRGLDDMRHGRPPAVFGAALVDVGIARRRIAGSQFSGCLY